MEDRLTEIEIKLGFAEDLLEALNRTVFRQQQQMEQLQREVGFLRNQLESLAPADRPAVAQEPPPHY